MPGRDPKTTVVIRITTHPKFEVSVLGLMSDLNDMLDLPFTLGMKSATSFYADALQLGLDPAECLALQKAQLEFHLLGSTPDAPVTAEWWMAYQDARCTCWELKSKITRIAKDNFRLYTEQLIPLTHPPWAEFVTLAGFRVRVA
jgi:hypothetical protein